MRALFLIPLLVFNQFKISQSTPTPTTRPTTTSTIMPTTTSQLSPSTSTTSTSTTPTSTAISASPGIYSTDFSFRRRLSSTNNSSLISNTPPITLVTGAPLLNYTCVALSQDASKWVAITDEGKTFVSLDSGVTFEQGATLKGFAKVKITVKGEVVFYPNTLSASGYASSTTLLIYDSPERLLPTSAPTSQPTYRHGRYHYEDDYYMEMD